MDERAPFSSTRPSDPYLPLVRRHAHDVRNGLNGFEIETSLLEVIHADSRTQDCIRRMRNQGNIIELALRFLLNRFAEPQIEAFPAVDVFNLWKSRGTRLSNFDLVTWVSEAEDALISVDASMVADLLCEGISYARGTSIEASVMRDGAEVRFQIRQRSESDQANLTAVNEWPEMEGIVQRNGGRHEVVTEPDGSVSRNYRFPATRLSWD
jgi:hypothetical protein